MMRGMRRTGGGEHDPKVGSKEQKDKGFETSASLCSVCVRWTLFVSSHGVQSRH